MNNLDSTVCEILRTLGRIEGELVEIRRLNARVSRLESYQSWMKGLWAAVAAAWGFVIREMFLR